MLLNRKMKAVLSALLVSTTVLAACSSNKDNGASSAASGSPGAQEPTKIIELKALTMGTEPASGMANFYKQLDELTKKDLGATIRFTFIPWGDEKNQISRAIVAKEYDIYVGGFWSDFKSFATKNAFADLKPLLSQTPELVKHYNGILDRITLDGKLYGIPQYGKPGGGATGFFYREDLRKQWGLPEIKDFDSVEKYLYKAKEEFPDTPMINDKGFILNVFRLLAGDKYLDPTGTMTTMAPVNDPYKVVSIYDIPEYKQALQIAKKWYDDGIVARDILASQANETSKTLELMKADKKPLEFSNHFGAISSGYINQVQAVNKDWEFGWLDYIVDLAPDTAFLPKHSVETTTMISVGAHSKNVETALKFIEKAHTDRAYYDLLQYGVKDENYKLDGESITYDGIDPKNKKPGWTGLNDGYMNRVEKYPGGWQKIYDNLQTEGTKLGEKNGIDPYEGFVFDTKDLTAEMANIETIRTQYAVPLGVGMVKKSIDEDLNTLNQQLKGAGMDKYMAALQKALDDFAATKKK
ncbi:Bacterial extracellular solute-binding protein [compost metagenome]